MLIWSVLGGESGTIRRLEKVGERASIRFAEAPGVPAAGCTLPLRPGPSVGASANRPSVSHPAAHAFSHNHKPQPLTTLSHTHPPCTALHHVTYQHRRHLYLHQGAAHQILAAVPKNLPPYRLHLLGLQPRESRLLHPLRPRPPRCPPFPHHRS